MNARFRRLWLRWGWRNAGIVLKGLCGFTSTHTRPSLGASSATPSTGYLHKALSVEAIRAIAVRAGLPADLVVEVSAVPRYGDVTPVEPAMFT